MNITHQYGPTHFFRSVLPEHQAVGKTLFEECFAVKPKDSILILADQAKTEEAQIVFELAKTHSSDLRLVFFENMTENGQEPSKEMITVLQQHSVGLLITNYSLTHTRGVATAIKKGARIASMPGITWSMMLQTLAADYAEIKKLSRAVADTLTTAGEITITTPAGTNVTASLKKRQGQSDDGDLTQPGVLGNLPAGEAFIAPVEESVFGQVIIDGSLADIELDQPIKMLIEAGKIVAIEGGQAARQLKASMEEVGPPALVVAEIGIGTNKKAQVKAPVLEAEKAFATAHIAFGDNIDFGGKNEAPFHSDGVMLFPTIKIDDQVILKAGSFLL